MTVTGFKPIGGRMKFKHLNLELYKGDVKAYMILKAHTWLRMLSEGKMPKKWSRVYKAGTNVDFDYAHSQEEFDAAEEQLKTYIETINADYELDLVLTEGE